MEDIAQISSEKQTGYLHQNFRLFHLKDKKNQEFEFHYHDFNKIIIFLSGNVTYLVEGKAYDLKPWDILLINHHDIHKPVIDPSVTYERVVLWLQQITFRPRQLIPVTCLSALLPLRKKVLI